LIRQQRKSKQKGPKRLVKDGPLQEKNKKDIIDEEEIEGTYSIEIERLILLFLIEVGTQLIEGSSFTIPNNIKSVRIFNFIF
jgi:hypothetical protein